MEALGINPGLLIVQIIAFAIVFLTLQAWVYKPLVSMMGSRKKKIAEGLEDARVAAEARADAEKEAARVLAEAHAQASKVVQEASDRAAAAAQQARAAVEAEVSAQRVGIVAQAEQERIRILGELRGQVAALAAAATQKLIGETLDQKRQHALIDEFFSGTSAGKVVVLEDASFQGDSAEVTSALPLSGEEQTVVKRELLSRAKAQVVTFRVDPGILGGLVVKVGEKIVDGSVATRLEDLRKTLK